MRLRTPLVAALVSCAFGRPAEAQLPPPILTTLDSFGIVGEWSDVALRADGRGVIAYTDSTGASVKVALCNDRACTSAVVRTIDTGAQFRGVSVAVGPFDEPMVAYRRPPTASSAQAAIRFARCVDPGCSAAPAVTLDLWEVLGNDTDLAVDPDGKPIVVYTRPAIASPDDDELVVVRCVDFACTQRTRGSHPDPQAASQPAVVIGGDGRPLFAVRLGSEVRVGHCSNPDCTIATDLRFPGSTPSLALGGDGRVAVGFRSGLGSEFRRCADLACTSLVPGGVIEPSHGSARIAIAPPDRPLAAYYGGPLSQLELKVERCLDATCAGASTAIPIGGENSFNHALAADRTGNALVSFFDAEDRDLRVAFLGTPPELSIGDAAVVEGPSGLTVVRLPVSLSGGLTGATVDFATADGTATAPSDYTPTSGSLTFPPGTSTLFVEVPVAGDGTIEPDETLRVLLSNAQGAPVIDGEGIGTIRDDDTPRRVSISDESTIEQPPPLFFTVSLDAPAVVPLSVDFTTQDLTATGGFDYTPVFGTLSFAPGETMRAITVSVMSDFVNEPDETFRVLLSNPQGSVIDDGEGIGTILDDDLDELPLPGELRHGASYTGDLAANPGPAADVDDFRLAQDPFASYEVVVDAVSGDAAPLVLERRASGGSVLQSGAPVGTGSAVAMRWLVSGTAPVTGETVRIAGACGTACGEDDAYRVRAHETTLRATRFNNSGPAGQTTVLLLQNRTGDPVSAVVRFWSAFGTLVATHALPAPIEPHGILVLNTAEVAPLASGTLTIAHDAPYGGLAGKSVAVDPPTGFSFDTPLEPRPR